MVGALRNAARERPEEPWLFYCEGWDWRWRSYARVADQVARCARTITAENALPDFGSLPPADRIAALLALRATGGAPLSSAEVLQSVPTCRGVLDGGELEIPPMDAGAPPIEVPWIPPSDEVRSRRSRSVRPVLFVQTELLAEERFLESWIALSLSLDAAWALEPRVDGLVGTVVWSRPSIAVLRPDGVETLVAAFRSSYHQKARKHLRLRRVLVVDSGEPGKKMTAEETARGSEEFGCPVEILDLSMAHSGKICRAASQTAVSC